MTTIITDALRASTDEDLRAALECGDPMVLRGLVYHATGNEEVAAIAVTNVPAGFASANVVADETGAARIRALAFDLLASYRDGLRLPPVDLPPGQLMRAMTLAAGEQVPEDELRMHKDILCVDLPPLGWGAAPLGGVPADFNVVVIGAGLAGVNAAVQLKAAGIDFVVLDKNGGVGGTWYNNRYPGARVDWPSRLYSHSFGIDFPFRHMFAPRIENESYIAWCADQYGLKPHLEFNCEVTKIIWNDPEGMWHIHSKKMGAVQVRRARAVISAIGLLERPVIPALPGLDQFGGRVFHTSRFDETVDLAGKRVAVIGTGASGMQMAPDLAPLVGHLSVFQRSPGWVLPAPGYRDALPDGTQWLTANAPFYTNWTRFVLGWMLGDHKLFKVFEVDPDWSDPHSVNAENKAVRERCLAHLHTRLANRPDLVAKCTPNYPVFANRPVIDNGWFEALQRSNVELVSSPIERFTATGIRTIDGTERPIDVAVMATGFNPNQYFSPIHVVGRDGMTIEELWSRDGPRAYWGIAMHHLPNFFIMYGPNANPRNLGPVQYGEWVMAYVLTCFRTMIENGWQSVEVTEQAFDAFNAVMDQRLDQLVSVNARTRHKSYYVTDGGRSAVQSPWASAEIWRALRQVRFEDYRITPAAGAAFADPIQRQTA